MIAISRIIRTYLKRERCSENTLPDKEEENERGMEEGGEEAGKVVMLVETEVEVGSLDGIASCTSSCVCAGYDEAARCCSAGNKREDEVEASRERFLRFCG